MAQDPAPVIVEAQVYKTNSANTSFAPYVAKLGSAFDVVVRLTDGPGGSVILNGSGAPFVETITVLVSATAIIDAQAGQVAAAGPVKGRVRLLVGAVSPLPNDLLQKDVWYTTQVVITKKNGSLVTYGESPPQPMGLNGFTTGGTLTPAGFGQYSLDPLTGLLAGPGPAVITGKDGAPGPTGPTGSAVGMQGPAGPTGGVGATGVAGPQGPFGAQGSPGIPGSPGPPGGKGPAGPTGVPGDPAGGDPDHDGDQSVAATDDLPAIKALSTALELDDADEFTGEITSLAIDTRINAVSGGAIRSRGSVRAKARVFTQSQQTSSPSPTGEPGASVFTFVPPDALGDSFPGDIVADGDLWADGDVHAWNGTLRALRMGTASNLPLTFFLTPGDVYADGSAISGRHLLVQRGGRVGVGIPDSKTHPGAYLEVVDREATVDQLAQTVSVSRTQDVSADDDLLALQATATSAQPFQFIEALRGSDVEFRVDGDGGVFADGTLYAPAADFAEMIRVAAGAGSVEAGDVLVIDPDHPRSVALSTEAFSPLVAGVYSTQPAFVGSDQAWDRRAAPDTEAARRGEPSVHGRADMAATFDEVPMAMVGIVPCKVTALNGPIRPGDLLVTAPIPGHAMRDDSPQPGTILGKSLGFLESDTGVIQVLVKLQ